MESLVQSYIDGEHFGLKPDDEIAFESDEAQLARAQMTRNTFRRDDGRYETSLLWREKDPNLPNNYHEALRRHRSLEKSLAKHAERRQQVATILEAYARKGYTRPVSSSGIPGRVWYMPIFTVPKGEKVRIVWDAAAETRGISLNKALLSGPDLTVPLL